MLNRTGLATIVLASLGFVLQGGAAFAGHPNGVVWEGEKGPGAGKHIVFIAGDHEYRGEETLPALARILAKHYGFKCSFFVTTDPKDGTIKPGSNHITGLEALKTADLMVLFTRFQAFDDEQMQHIDDYLATGKPVIGLRTTTHGFKGLGGKFAKYNEGYRGDDERWRHGFGEEILGEHWVGHFGRNHRQSGGVGHIPPEAVDLAHVTGAGGGAGLAIVDALCERGIAALNLTEINSERKDAALTLVRTHWPDVQVRETPEHATLLIDATTLGKSASDPLPFTADAIQNAGLCCDVVTSAGDTPFLRSAKDARIATVSGDDMGAGQLAVQLGFLGLL